MQGLGCQTYQVHVKRGPPPEHHIIKLKYFLSGGLSIRGVLALSDNFGVAERGCYFFVLRSAILGSSATPIMVIFHTDSADCLRHTNTTGH